MSKKYTTLQWVKHQKRWFGKWHTYLGIMAGRVVSFIAATGSIPVVLDEIDHALNPKLYHKLEETPKPGFGDIFCIIKKELMYRLEMATF